MLTRLYERTLALSRGRSGTWGLGAVSFAESSFFPIPPDLLLIPMVIASPRRAFLYAGICTLFSVLGGVAGYMIGALMFEHIGQPILAFYGLSDPFAEFSESFNAHGALAVLIAGLTPFPYKVVTIASGFTGLDIVQFILWSTIARGLRFFVVAALLWKFGDPIRDFIERRLGLVFGAFVLLLVLGFAVVFWI